MRANVDCAEQIVGRLEAQLRGLRIGNRPAGGPDRPEPRRRARALAGGAQSRQRVAALVMLGHARARLARRLPPVLRTVRWLARLGDLGLPGVFSSSCRDGDCCATFREDLLRPAGGEHRGDRHPLAQRRRSSTGAHALTRTRKQVEIDSSHAGMSVHPGVYRVLERALDASE